MMMTMILFDTARTRVSSSLCYIVCARMSIKAVHRRIVHVTVRAPRDVRVQVCIEQASDDASDDDTTDGSAVVAPPRPLTPPFAEAPPAQGLKRARPEPRAPPERTMVDALMYPGLDVAALQKTFTPHTNTLNAHPRDARVRTVFTDKLHEYWIDGVVRKRADKWFSATAIIHDLFRPFDADYKAGALGTTSTNPRYKDKTKEEILADWDKTKNDGSSKHAAYDAWLQHEPHPAGALQPPIGFYRAFAELTARFDIWRTEMSVFDEDICFMGQIDLVLRERATGKLFIGDHKNCHNEDLEVPFGKEMGRHPFTVDMADSKLNHYLIQLSLYKSVLERKYGVEVEDELVLLNYRPSQPHEYYIYKLKALDLAPLFALMPWDVNDPRHSYFAGDTLVPRIAPDDPRCVGPTTRVPAPMGKLPDDMVWTGALYPSAKARAELDAKIQARKERGESYDDLVLRRDYPASPFQHPWRWFGAVPRGAAGYYERYLLNNTALIELLPWVHGKRVCCWCASPDQICHADIIVRYANALGRPKDTSV
jgi:hypothetical protein